MIAGMGLAMEAGIVGALGGEVGHLSATFSIFLIGGLMLSLGMIYFGSTSMRHLFSQPRWLLTGGIIGPAFVLILTIATPLVGVGTTMVGILFGQVSASLIIDHYGLLGSQRRGIDMYRIIALIFILTALWLIY